MRRGFMVALLLCVGLVFGATTPQPSELKKVPKSEIAKLQETFKTLKKGDTRTKAIINVDFFTFNPNTDDLYQFTVDNQQMFLATRIGQTMFVPVQKIGVTKLKYGETLCAFMGIDDAYSTFDSRVGINSAGGWFYLTSYPTTDLVIFDRSSHEMDKEGKVFPDIEHLSFRFIISKGGLAEIHRSSLPSAHVTMSVETPKKIPLNTWVYIQGKQKGLLHTVGWKTADDESIASKDFERASADLQVIPMRSAFMHEVYTKKSDDPKQDKRERITYESDLMAPNAPAGATYRDLGHYPKAADLNCTTQIFETKPIFPDSSQPIALREFFYQPLMDMFTLMDNYESRDKDIGQNPTKVFGLDTSLLVELLNATVGASDYFRFASIVDADGIPIDYANVDVYVDDNYNAVVFDLRNVPPAPAK